MRQLKKNPTMDDVYSYLDTYTDRVERILRKGGMLSRIRYPLYDLHESVVVESKDMVENYFVSTAE